MKAPVSDSVASPIRAPGGRGDGRRGGELPGTGRRRSYAACAGCSGWSSRRGQGALPRLVKALSYSLSSLLREGTG